jgi:hypothetical protein
VSSLTGALSFPGVTLSDSSGWQPLATYLGGVLGISFGTAPAGRTAVLWGCAHALLIGLGGRRPEPADDAVLAE